MTADRPRWRLQKGRVANNPFLPISLLLIGLLWCGCWFLHSWNYYEDDAYIHLEFARSLASGLGFAFNGKVVYGDTAPLWALALAGIHFLVPEWLTAGKLLTILGTVFFLWGAYVLSSRLVLERNRDDVFPAMMLLLLVANPFFSYWSSSGMEALTAAALSFWSLIAVTTPQPSRQSFLAGCFLVGAGPLLRPELVFLAAIVAPLLLYQWYKLPERQSLSKRVIVLGMGLFLLGGPILAWSAYALHTFGSLVPNTNAPKRALPEASVPLRLLALYLLGFPAIICTLVVGFVNLTRCLFKGIELSVGFDLLKEVPLAGWVFLIWSAICATFYIADHSFVQSRYILATAPGLMLAIMAVVYSKFPGPVFLVAYIALLSAAVAVSVVSAWPFIRNKALFDRSVNELAMFIRNQLPQDAPVAVFFIGQVGFVSQHPLIDTGGITRPSVIPYMYAQPASITKWAKSEGAVYLVSTEKPEPGAVLVFSVNTSPIGWSLNPAYYSRQESINLWRLSSP